MTALSPHTIVLTRGLATWAILLAVVLAAFPQRLFGPSFGPLLSLPGAPISCAVPLLAGGIIVLAGSLAGTPAACRWGCTFLLIWSCTFAALFGIAVARDPRASVTGVASYALIAFFAAVLGDDYRPRREPRRRPWRR